MQSPPTGGFKAYFHSNPHEMPLTQGHESSAPSLVGGISRSRLHLFCSADRHLEMLPTTTISEAIFITKSMAFGSGYAGLGNWRAS